MPGASITPKKQKNEPGRASRSAQNGTPHKIQIEVYGKRVDGMFRNVSKCYQVL